LNKEDLTGPERYPPICNRAGPQKNTCGPANFYHIALQAVTHYGEGVSFESSILKQAIELNSYARSLGFLKTDVFPGINGEIMITIYHFEHYLEFTIENKETITFCQEKNDEEISYQENLTFDQAKEKIKKFGMETWKQFESCTLNITIGKKEDFKDSPSKTQEEERIKEFQLSITNVYFRPETQSVNILGAIIGEPEQQVNHRFIDGS
jgi:hypothetical protein